MKYILTLFASLFLILGCGKSTKEISKAEKIVIVHDVGIAGCLFLEKRGNAKIQKDAKLKKHITNISYNSKGNRASCQTYGKKKSTLSSYDDVINIKKSTECAELQLSDAQEAYPNKDFSLLKNTHKSCVVAFNVK